MINDMMKMCFDVNEYLLRMPYNMLGSSEMFMNKTKVVAERYSTGEQHWLLVFLDDILSHYNVERILSIQEALSIFEDTIKRNELWWLRETTNHLSPQKSTYMCAVAFLESINYWCSYYSYAYITFDEERLRETLNYPLSINIDFYLEK